MSEGSQGDKTEPPSPKKLRDARQKGQVARSQEVVTTVTLISVVGYIWVTWNQTFDDLINLLNISAALTAGDFRVNAANGIAITARVVLRILLPILGVAILSAIAANYVQVGSIFAFDNLTPKLDKISPAAGAKRIFSMKQIVEVLKAIVKIVFLSILLYIVLRGAIGSFIYSLPCGLPCLAHVTSVVLFQLLIYSAFAFIVVSALDFAFQKHTYTKSLMMTKEDVKREYKESEGDPHIKGKRKQLAQELIMGDDANVARKSTAVVINPTHLAVVLRYVEGETPLPTVVAKGRNRNAHVLRTAAEEAGVPVFRNIVLARALYAQTEVNDYVPDELFGAVAEVLAWVAKNKKMLYKGPFGSGVIDMDAGDHRAKRQSSGLS